MVSRAALIALLLLVPQVAAAETVQERLAAAVAAHDYRALQEAAAELGREPGYASAASAASDFSALALAGAPAERACVAGAERPDALVYLVELSRLLERSLRFPEVATCLVAASALEPTPERRQQAARALLRAGRDAEASKLLEADGDTELLAEVDGLAGRQVAQSGRWSELRWVVAGAGAEAFAAEVASAYGAYVEATGHRLAQGLLVERLDGAVRARTRLGGLPSEGVAGVTLGPLVSVTSGLPVALEREVIWHELAHAFLAVRAPYGGSAWLGEAAAFAWSRSLLSAAEFESVAWPTGSGWSGWLDDLERSDDSILEGAARMARDGFAAEVGCWFAGRFGMAALLEVYGATAQGEAVAAAFARVSGVSDADLRAAFEAERAGLSRPMGRRGP